MTSTKFDKRIKLGEVDGEGIYLSPPSWDCGWYWGFGYLGNRNCHYHVNGLKKIEKYNHEAKLWSHEFVNLFDGFKRHFGDTFILKNDADIWTLSELFTTFYTLKEAAEVLGRGSSHYTNNPCESIVRNEAETKRINEVVLPAIFDEIYWILTKK